MSLDPLNSSYSVRYNPQSYIPLDIWNEVLKWINPFQEYRHFCNFGVVCRDFYKLCIRVAKSRSDFQEYLLFANLRHYQIEQIRQVDSCTIQNALDLGREDRNDVWLYLSDAKGPSYFMVPKRHPSLLHIISPLRDHPFIKIDLADEFRKHDIETTDEDQKAIACFPGINQFILVTSHGISRWEWQEGKTAFLEYWSPLSDTYQYISSACMHQGILFLTMRRLDRHYYEFLTVDLSNKKFDLMQIDLPDEETIKNVSFRSLGDKAFCFFQTNTHLQLRQIKEVNNGACVFKCSFLVENCLPWWDFTPRYMLGNSAWLPLHIIPTSSESYFGILDLNRRTKWISYKKENEPVFLRDNLSLTSSKENNRMSVIFLPTKEDMGFEFKTLLQPIIQEGESLFSVWGGRENNNPFLRVMIASKKDGDFNLRLVNLKLSKKKAKAKKMPVLKKTEKVAFLCAAFFLTLALGCLAAWLKVPQFYQKPLLTLISSSAFLSVTLFVIGCLLFLCRP